jgi:hypothetical protein
MPVMHVKSIYIYIYIYIHLNLVICWVFLLLKLTRQTIENSRMFLSVSGDSTPKKAHAQKGFQMHFGIDNAVYSVNYKTQIP